MSTNLISLASQYLTPDVLAKIGSALGLDRSAIGRACSAAVPALFGHFANLASTPDGARRLYGAVNEQDTSILGNLSNVLGRPGVPSAAGGSLSSLGSLLGGSSLSTLTGALGRFAGLNQSSVSSLLGMVSPVLMAILGKQSAEQGLNAPGLASLLAAQKDNISAAMPSGFMEALQSATPDQGARAFPRSPIPGTGRAPQQSWRSLTWILPLIAVGLLAWWLLSNRATRVAEHPQAQETTAAAEVDVRSSARKALDNLTTTLQGINDEHSAQAALPGLQKAAAELDNVIGLSGRLPEAGKKAVGGIVAAAQPATTQLFDKVLGIPGVKEVAKPQIDSLRAKLNTLSKDQAHI